MLLPENGRLAVWRVPALLELLKLLKLRFDIVMKNQIYKVFRSIR